jgi:hypothetical protein
MKNAKCESCLMPFKMDPGVRENEKYCSYCWKDGKFTFEGDFGDFQKTCYDAMRKQGMGKMKAGFFAWLIRFAPRWKK